MGSQSALSGAGTLFSLYELWIADDQGCKVFYQVGSQDGKQAYETTRGGQDAFIDLAAKYPGFFKDVPGGYYFGCHFANETDPNKKGYPFIWDVPKPAQGTEPDPQREDGAYLPDGVRRLVLAAVGRGHQHMDGARQADRPRGEGRQDQLHSRRDDTSGSPRYRQRRR